MRTLAAVFILTVRILADGSATAGEVAKRVYEKIARAAGIPHPPPLVIVPWEKGTRSAGAYLRTSSGPLPRREIVVDDKLLSVCQSMGQRSEDCLAYFLGHEIAHFVHDDNWGSHFAKVVLSESISPERSAEIETQADRFGGFFATLAGYDSLAVGSVALRRLYADYGINPNLTGYLPLAEREKLPQATRDYLSRWIPLFDIGQLLIALGYCRDAAFAFEALLDQFPSREIFNDAGVAWAMLYKPNVVWVLDNLSRLPSPTARGGDEGDNAFERARDNFERAIAVDREYAAAHRNLGLLLQIEGQEPERATAELKTAERLERGLATQSFNAELPVNAASTSAAVLAQSEILPQGKRPADMLPIRLEPLLTIGGGHQFYTGVVNGKAALLFRPIGKQRSEIAAIFVTHPPETWVGHLGPGRVVSVFPSRHVIYEEVGVLMLERGAWVFQVW